MTNSFDLRAATLSAQMRRSNQTDQINSQLAVPAPSDDYLPMTTTFGGRFGGRTISGRLEAFMLLISNILNRLQPPIQPLSSAVELSLATLFQALLVLRLQPLQNMTLHLLGGIVEIIRSLAPIVLCPPQVSR
jgi:hypothetical protein